MYIYIPRYGRIARFRFLISIISVKRSGSHVSSCNHEFDKLAINAKKTVGTRFGFPLNVEEQCAKAEVHRCVICNLIKPTIDNRVARGGGEGRRASARDSNGYPEGEDKSFEISTAAEGCIEVETER